MHQDDLLKLWDMSNVPLCDEGLDLAGDFLVSYGQAVDKIDLGHSSADRHAFNLLFNQLVAHANSCPKCNEV
jgi:hypothetical protein